MRIFSELQTRFRVNRFGEAGKRFGLIEYDQRDLEQLEMRRMHAADDSRRKSFHRALKDSIKR